jgi:hypothetical protein
MSENLPELPLPEVVRAHRTSKFAAQAKAVLYVIKDSLYEGDKFIFDGNDIESWPNEEVQEIVKRHCLKFGWAVFFDKPAKTISWRPANGKKV